VYFFGGGDIGSSSAIQRVEAPGRTVRAGSLPIAASDVAAATIGATAYVVGGFTGTRALNTVVAWRPGRDATVVARLPRPLRYAAVATAGQRLVISGGTSGLAARREVFSVDPTTGAVRQIALLPRPLTHAGAAPLNGVVYVVGGRGSDLKSQRAEVLGIDPISGAVTRAGTLPHGLSDAGVTAVGNRILIAGGQDATGAMRAEVLEMTARP
jgi:N-acetylneuraminic acid mutarotase